MSKKKLERKLASLCTEFASQALGEHVKVKIGEDFYAIVGAGDYPVEKRRIFVNPYRRYRKNEARHKEIEKKIYHDAEHTLGYFTSSLLHEVGHIATMRFFKADALDGFKEQFQLLEAECETDFDVMYEYKLTPQEMLADVWFLKLYLPHNYAKAAAFEKKAMKTVKKLRKIKKERG